MNETGEKILYLCADLGIPYWGRKGSSVHIREFVKAMKSAGYDISALVRFGAKSKDDENNINLHRISSGTEAKLIDEAVKLGGNSELLKEIKGFYFNAKIERQLKKLHMENNFEYLYERYSLFSAAGLRFASKYKIPFILEVNSPLILETSRYRNLYLAELAEAVEKYLYGGADQIVAVSDELQEYILSRVPEARVNVVPNGVSDYHFRETRDDGNAEKVLGPAGNEPVIGFVGRLRPWHGIDILIDSFAEYLNRGNRGRLVIIGDDGGLKNKLGKMCEQQGIAGMVKFTGSVPHSMIPSLLKRIDILVAPYPRLDGFYFSSLKIFEYMAAGKPIAASRIGQIDQILEHEKTALLVPPGDTDALADALARLAGDAALGANLGTNARAEALAKHTWSERIETISRILNKAKHGQN